MINIQIVDMEKSFEESLILNKINLTIYPKKINIIVGPSGCGKSTLLQIVSGLDKDFNGFVSDISTEKISYVFQEHCLLEWKNVEKNIAYALSGKIDKKDFLQYSTALGLNSYLKHYPSQLSGGLLQRVNLLRAFLNPANILLMDEPFKSLDIQSKQEAINLFLRIQSQKELTVILVTHSLEEAVKLGNYIHVLSNKPTKKLDTFINPYFCENNYSIEDRRLFLNKIKEMIQ